MKKLLLCSVAFILTVVMPIAKPHTPKASAESIWMNGATITEEPKPLGLVNGGNLECEYFTLKSQYVYRYGLQNGRVQYSDSTYESDGSTYPDVCMAQNDNGLVGMGYWAKDNNVNETLPVDAGPYTMMPAPGGNATVIMTPAPTFGTQYSINYNLPYIGYLGVKVLGSGLSQRSEKVWKIDTTKIEQFLTYSDGQIVRIDQIGFSDNGRFMVAQLSRRGMVLVDLETKKMTPFFPNSIVNGINMFMNVSNDGKYVAVYSSAGLSVHDVSGCTASYAFGQWPSGGALVANGCQSREYLADVRTAYPLLANVTRVRFAPNGGSFSIDISWRDSSNELITKRVRLNANGYVSSARGYLGMGDSYSSGEGDTEGGDWYEPGTDEQGDINTFAGRNLCHLSRRSYPYLMAVELGYLSNNATTPPADGMFHSVACSGAKIHNIIGSVGEKQDEGDANDFAITDNQYRFDDSSLLRNWLPGSLKQVDALNAIGLLNNEVRSSANPEIITIGIGGNDAGFGDFLSACTGRGTCEHAIPNSKKGTDVVLRIAQNRKRLVKTYKEIKESAPEARVYVHGYPKIVEGSGGYCAVNVRFDDQERLFVEQTTHYLNEVVKSAAQEAGVVYVNVEDIFDRQKLCSGVYQDQILVNGVTAGNDVRPDPGTGYIMYGLANSICLRACIGTESFHPKPAGFVKYKEAILAQTNNLTSAMPVVSPGPVPVPDMYFGSEAINKVIELNANNGFPTQKLVLQENLITGFEFTNKAMSVHLNSLAPNSVVEVVVESTPTSLGKYVSGAGGSFDSILTLPNTLESGYHEIHIIGTDVTGKKVDYYQPFILGIAENDFDGDNLLDDVDSCSTVADSNIDIDHDGIDDVCDESPVVPVVPPQVPGIPDLHQDSDSGVSQEDNITNDISPTFDVSCNNSNLVTILNEDAAIGSAPCVNMVAVVTVFELTDGVYDLTARQTDENGISSSDSGFARVTIDTQPPLSPSAPDLVDDSDTGESSSDNTTTDTSPIITVECTAAERVRVYLDGLSIAEGLCNGGIYSTELVNLTQRQYAVTASIVDIAGNESPKSLELILNITSDTTGEEIKCHKYRRYEIKCRLKRPKPLTWYITSGKFKLDKNVNVYIADKTTMLRVKR